MSWINRERKFQRNELARVLLELLLQGVNWPGSEKAVNPSSHSKRGDRKGKGRVRERNGERNEIRGGA